MAAEAPARSGKLSKQTWYVILAGAGGIVVYAWWSRSRSSTAQAATVATAQDASMVPATDYTGPGQYYTYGNSTVTAGGGTATVYTTNADWTVGAETSLANAGYDPTAVLAALGAYLSRQPLSPDQIVLVQAAIAVAGYPPVGGPYPITPSLPSPAPSGGGGDSGGGGGSSTPPPAQVQPVTVAPSVRTTVNSRSQVAVQWGPVPNAVAYRIYMRTGPDYVTVGASGWSFAGRTTGTSWSTGAQPNWWYDISVRGEAADGTLGPPPTPAQWIHTPK